MGLSGLVGAGAQAGLDQLLERQMVEQQMAMRLKALEAEERNRQESLRLQEKAIAQRDAESVRETESRERDRRDTANTRGVSLMLQERGLMDEEAAREAARNAPKPIKLREVTVRGANGRPVNRMVPETEEVEEYREPKAAAGGAEKDPKYIQVVGPDGQLRLMTADEIRAQGSVPTQKAGADRDVERRKEQAQGLIAQARETIGKLKAMPGKSGAVGAKGPMSLFGWLDKPMEGSSAANYRQMLETLKSQLALPKLEVMRGLGQMSNREFETVQKAATALDHVLSEGVYDKELENLDAALAIAAQKTGGGAASVPDASAGGGTTVQAPDGQTYTFPTAEAAATFRAKIGGQ